jgi:hypothetical protein
VRPLRRISDATFYNWRNKYSGLELSEMRRLRHLENHNLRLKAIVADQALDIGALKDVLAKTATARDKAADGGGYEATHGLSERRAGGLVDITRRRFRRPLSSDRNAEPHQRLRALAARRWLGAPLTPAFGLSRPVQTRRGRWISSMRACGAAEGTARSQ